MLNSWVGLYLSVIRMKAVQFWAQVFSLVFQDCSSPLYSFVFKLYIQSHQAKKCGLPILPGLGVSVVWHGLNWEPLIWSTYEAKHLYTESSCSFQAQLHLSPFTDPVWCCARDSGGGPVPLHGHAHQQAVCSSSGRARHLRSWWWWWLSCVMLGHAGTFTELQDIVCSIVYHCRKGVKSCLQLHMKIRLIFGLLPI